MAVNPNRRAYRQNTVPSEWGAGSGKIINDEFTRLYKLLQISLPSADEGSLLVLSDGVWTELPINTTQSRYLGNPAGVPGWEQVNLADGVQGFLPVGNIVSASNPTDVLTGAGWAAPGAGALTFLKVTAQQTINFGANTYGDITGLTFPVVNGNVYGFEFYIVFQSAQTTTGYRCSVNCPTGTLDFFARNQTVANSSSVGVASWLQRHSVTRDDMTGLATTITAGVDLICTFEGRYICTANGTFAARFANELAANTDVTIEIGSWGRYWVQ